MDSEALNGDIRPGSRRWCRMVLIPLALTVIAFLLGSLLLATRQRVAIEVEAFGNISQILLRLGKDAPVGNLKS